MFVHVLCKAIWQLCTLDLDSVYYLKKEREKKLQLFFILQKHYLNHS